MRHSMKLLKHILIVAGVMLMSGCLTLEGAGNNLEGSQWALQSINEQVMVVNIAPSLTFIDEAKVGGSAGCNRYTASYEIAGDTFSIGKVGSTRKLCSGDRMTVEKQYLGLLKGVSKITRMNDQLVLTTESGDTLIYTKGVSKK